MPAALVLAHGGAVGLVFELSFVLVPILIFAVLARVSSRRHRAAEEEGEGRGDGHS